jgi:hypothetical protein
MLLAKNAFGPQDSRSVNRIQRIHKPGACFREIGLKKTHCENAYVAGPCLLISTKAVFHTPPWGFGAPDEIRDEEETNAPILLVPKN